MKIGIIQASSQKDKNSIIERCVRDVIGRLNNLTKKSLVEIIPYIDRELIQVLKARKNVYEYILDNGTNKELLELLKKI